MVPGGRFLKYPYHPVHPVSSLRPGVTDPGSAAEYGGLESFLAKVRDRKTAGQDLQDGPWRSLSEIS